LDEDAAATRNAGRLGREHETNRVAESCEPPGFDRRQQVFLLDRSVKSSPPAGVRHAEVLQRRAGAGQPGAPGHDC
jgi:hypothetical protein